MKFNSFLLFAILVKSANGFSTPGSLGCRSLDSTKNPLVLRMENTDEGSMPSMKDTNDDQNSDMPDQLEIPYTYDEMIDQASEAMKAAYAAGKKRQIFRLLLPRDPESAQIGQYLESDASIDTENLVLAPPDETWQGGIMQLYRACAPTCQSLLTRFSGSPGGVPPTLVEDRSVDDSGVDGVGLWMSQSATPSEDVSCFVQPTQETIDAVETISKQAGDRLVALMNPQWRNVDDALDAYSKSDNWFLGQVSSFLGGKGNSLRRLEEMGYESIYTIEGYVCKGGNVRLLKRFDSDWHVFAENDSATDYIPVGTSVARPTYQDVDKMLDAKGISLKYARDMGFAPKL